VLAEVENVPENDPATEVEAQLRVEELERALGQLSPRVQAALILHRRDGLSLEEIAVRFGVSRSMVKKYLAKALRHCRQQLESEE